MFIVTKSMRWDIISLFCYTCYLLYVVFSNNLSIIVTTTELLSIILSGNVSTIHIDESKHKVFALTSGTVEIQQQNPVYFFTDEINGTLPQCTVASVLKNSWFEAELPNYHTFETQVNALNVQRMPPLYYFRSGASTYVDTLLTGLMYVGIFLALRGIYRSYNNSVMSGHTGDTVIRADDKTRKKVTMKDVAGLDEVKGEIKEYIRYLKNRQKYIDLGARLPRGLLLIGAP